MGQSYSTEYFYPPNKSVILLNDSINIILINCTDNLKLHNYKQLSYRLAGRGYVVVVIKDENKNENKIRDLVKIFNTNLIEIGSQIKKYILQEFDKNIEINKVILIAHDLAADNSLKIAKSQYVYNLTHLVLLNPIINTTNNNDNSVAKMIITTSSTNSYNVDMYNKLIVLPGAKSDIFYNKYMMSEQEINEKSIGWNNLVQEIFQFIVL